MVEQSLYRIKLKKALILFFIFFASPDYAVIYSPGLIASGMKVGIFTSTFDPISLAVEDLIEKVVESAHFDYVFVVPSDFTPHKPRTTSIVTREEMLKIRFQSHSKVMVLEPGTMGHFRSRKLPPLLESAVGSEGKVTGVVLHGDIKGASVKKWVMETLLPVRSWLILTPQAVYDENKLETMRSHPVEYLKAEHPKSTSSIRAALLNNKGFYSDEVSLDAAALGLSADVLDYIQKKGIYLKKGSLCNFFADFF